MLKTVMLIGAFALTPPQKEPRSVDQSQKTATELSACVVLKLTEARGYEVESRANGDVREIRLKFRVMGVAATAATFLIEDQGDHRQLTIFATGKPNGAPRTIAERARTCSHT